MQRKSILAVVLAVLGVISIAALGAKRFLSHSPFLFRSHHSEIVLQSPPEDEYERGGYTLEDATKATLNVIWTKPERFDPQVIFQTIVPEKLEGSVSKSDFLKKLQCSPNLWKHGVIKDGPYHHSTLFFWDRTENACDEESWNYTQFILVSPNGKQARLLRKGLMIGYKEDREYLIPAPYLTIEAITAPLEITLTNGKKLIRWEGEKLTFESNDVAISCWDEECFPRLENNGPVTAYEKLTVASEGELIYKRADDPSYYSEDESTCIQVITRDGKTHNYRSSIPYNTVEGNHSFAEELQIKWSLPGVTHKIYSSEENACALNRCPNVIQPENISLTSLVIAGSTIDGDPIYIIPTSTKRDVVPNSGNAPAELYWKDALGRWIQYSINYPDRDVFECGFH